MITGPQARELGRKIVFENPAGIGPTAIAQKILALHLDMKDDKGRPNGTIRGAVWDLDKRFPELIEKTAAGFAPKNGATAPQIEAEKPTVKAPKKIGRAKPAPSKETRETPPPAILGWQNQAATAGWISSERASEQTTQIAALEDAVSQAHTEIENRDTRIARLEAQRTEIIAALRKLAYSICAAVHGEAGEFDESTLDAAIISWVARGNAAIKRIREDDRIGVIAEAQNATVLVDIRQVALAGSEEGTLEAVRRVVDELGKVRTQLALTGIKDDGKRLKAARKLAGVDQKTLGAKLGYKGRHTIDDIERGKYPLAKHPRVLKWVQKVEAKHAQDGV